MNAAVKHDLRGSTHLGYHPSIVLDVFPNMRYGLLLLKHGWAFARVAIVYTIQLGPSKQLVQWMSQHPQHRIVWQAQIQNFHYF